MLMKKGFWIIFAVISLFCITSAGSYAYFTPTYSNGADRNASFAITGYSSTFKTSATNCSLTPTAKSMLNGSAGTVATSKTCTLTINYKGTDTSTETCSFDIVYSLSGYTKTTSATKEFTISATKSLNSGTATSVLSETQLANGTNTALISSQSITATSAATTNLVYTFTTSWYNTTQVQDSHMGKTYTATVSIANVVC